MGLRDDIRKVVMDHWENFEKMGWGNLSNCIDFYMNNAPKWEEAVFQLEYDLRKVAEEQRALQRQVSAEEEEQKRRLEDAWKVVEAMKELAAAGRSYHEIAALVPVPKWISDSDCWSPSSVRAVVTGGRAWYIESLIASMGQMTPAKSIYQGPEYGETGEGEDFEDRWLGEE